jgi:hypothetical protein
MAAASFGTRSGDIPLDAEIIEPTNQLTTTGTPTGKR